MSYSVYDYGNLYTVFLENEIVFGFDRAVMSIEFDCRDFEYVKNGIVLYGSEPNGMLRSYNTLVLSDKPVYLAMHDGKAEIKPQSGSRIIPNENGEKYSFTCTNGGRSLTVSFKGNCRCEGNMLHFRRGETEIELSEPTVPEAVPKRRGFEYESEKCLALIEENGDLAPDSELLPLLLLVSGLKSAVFDPRRAENIKSLLSDMTEKGRRTAEAVLHRYYRAFGKIYPK